MVKKVFYDDKSEMTVCFTDTNTFVFEITDSEEPGSIHFQNVELSTEDVEDLINDLQYYLSLNSAKQEAKEQNDSKNKLSAQIQKDIEERFGDKYYITAEGKAIKKEKYNFVPSVIELEALKKENNGKKRI